MGRARGRRSDGRPWPTGPVPTGTGAVEVVVAPEDPARVTLLVNGVPSSHLDLEDPRWLEFEYMQHVAAVVDLLPPGPVRAVHLGAAGCSLPRWVDATRPGSRQVAVDVDGELLRLVREWFDLPRAPRLRLRTGDAREVLAALPAASHDVVVRDVFAGDTTPRHLLTTGFVAAAARVLAPGGVYLANCADRPPLALARAEAATTASAFDQVVLLAEPGVLKGRRYGNLVLAATGPAGPDLTAPALDRALRALAVPVRLLAGDALRAFVAGARPLGDEPAPPGDDPAPPRAEPAPLSRAEAAPPGGDAASDGSGQPVRAGGPSRPGDPWGPA